MEEDEGDNVNNWPDSPEEDALIIDEGNVEGPLSPVNSRDRGETSCYNSSKPLRILVERDVNDPLPLSFTLDVRGDDGGDGGEVEVVGALDATPTSSRRAASSNPYPRSSLSSSSSSTSYSNMRMMMTGERTTQFSSTQQQQQPPPPLYDMMVSFHSGFHSFSLTEYETVKMSFVQSLSVRKIRKLPCGRR